MANEDLIRPKRTPVGHRNGGWVIHFPAVVCTRPALAAAYDLFWCFCAFSCAFRRSLIALRCPRVWSVSENSLVLYICQRSVKRAWFEPAILRVSYLHRAAVESPPV